MRDIKGDLQFLYTKMMAMKMFSACKGCGKQNVYFHHISVHQLVWAAFGEHPPGPNEMICHNDAAPLDEEGCYSQKRGPQQKIYLLNKKNE